MAASGSNITALAWETVGTESRTRVEDAANMTAIDTHDHNASTTGKGVRAIQTVSAPSVIGQEQVTGELLKWYGTAVHTAVDLDTTQTITGAKTHSGTNTFTGTTDISAATVPLSAAQTVAPGTTTLALPATNRGLNYVTITGTQALSDVSGPATAGLYFLQWTNATPGAVTNGNHLKLASNFAPIQNGGMWAWWDATNLNEISRTPTVFKEGGKGTATSNQNITSTASPGTDITGLSVAFTPDGAHDVKITVSLPDLNIATGSRVSIAIQKDGAIINTTTINASSTGVSPAFQAHLTHIDAAPTNASHTYKVSAWMSGADTLKTINGDGTTPTNLILVEQIG